MASSKTKPRQVGRQSSVAALVPAEGNFEEHPYFRVGDRNAGEGILQYRNELRTNEGNVLQQSWTVRAAHGRGLPGRFDQDVYVALLQMIDHRGLPEDGWIHFSLYELVDLMGRSHSGRDYRQVRESLKRLATTSVESENAFYHRGRKEYLTDTFSLLTEIKLSEYEGPGGERGDRNRVHLSKFFVESYRANYLKNIDARLYWSLSSPIAKRLYRLIDKKRGGKGIWEVELFSLRDRIPLSSYKYASKIKEKLAPAHKELAEKEFLEGVGYRKSDGVEFAAYRITTSYKSRRAVALEPRTGDDVFCIQRLKAEGMEADAAELLVASYGRDRVMHYVEALPYRRNLRNPAGWLRKAIEENYDLDLPPSPDGAVQPLLPHPDPPESSDAFVHNTLQFDCDPAIPDPQASIAWEKVVADFPDGGDSSPSIAPWFDSLVPTSLENDVLTLSAPNDFARGYVEERFHEQLQSALRIHLGPRSQLLVRSTNDST